MNPKARRFRLRPCAICPYPFADAHHLYSRVAGGGRAGTLWLCPNHHRFANMVQVMVDQGVGYAQIEHFAHEHFDEAFNTMLLRALFERQVTGRIDAFLAELLP